MNSSDPSYYFSTRNLATIAVLSALGGVLSTFVGYLGLLLNSAIGTPFGAGQFLSGLHVFWIILATGITRKPGAATATGFLKGFVEFFTGSTHGLVIVFVSLIQGIIVDIGLSAFRHRDSLPVYSIVGGFAAASNVLVFQLLFFSGTPGLFIMLLVILAFCSGIIFAGYFGHATTSLVITSNILRSLPNGATSRSKSLSPWKRLGPYKLSAIVFLITIAFGTSLYAVFVWRPVIDPLSCEVVGQVSQPYRFSYIAFTEHEITIEAELIGSVTYVPPQNYTGIPLSVILAEAQPLTFAETLQVLSSDGFSAPFSIDEVLDDSEIILIVDNGLRLVAKNYHGSYWVQKVVSLVIT
ncbi:MAG: ECF transporter S component [Candidatus Hermodarchaeota archaeon]|nr:ECF transporter S component [Candidatus Hermodarchaeota archaeon]